MTPPLIFGVLNLTPDSFSDGGEYVRTSNALAQMERLFTNGADYVDIGAESSRPGAVPISAELEWQRLAPILETCFKSNTIASLSVDTRHPNTMLKAADMGVGFINDIDGGKDEAILQQLATPL